MILRYLSSLKLVNEFGAIEGLNVKEDIWRIKANLDFVEAEYQRTRQQSVTEIDFKKLHHVVRYLDQTVIDDIVDPRIRVHQWVRFDLDLGSSTLRRDTGSRSDDVAVFAGLRLKHEIGQERDLAILLCGSSFNLTERVGMTMGRSGSGSEWMYDVILELHQREKEGMFAIPTLPEELISCQGYGSLDDQAEIIHHMAIRDQTPSQRGRLRGYARVLRNVEQARYGQRLVVATPLYVEAVQENQELVSPATSIPSLRSRRLWRTMVSKVFRRSEHVSQSFSNS
jgi:hypothetical protein